MPHHHACKSNLRKVISCLRHFSLCIYFSSHLLNILLLFKKMNVLLFTSRSIHLLTFYDWYISPMGHLCSPPYLSIALIILYYQMRITRQIFDSCSVMREGFPIGQWIRYWFGIKLGWCGVKLGWCNNKTLIRIKERSLRFTKKKGGYIAFFSQVGDVGPKMHKTMWTSHLRLLYQPQLAVLTCGTIERERIERRLSKASSLTSSFRERQSFNAAVKGPSPWLKVKIHQLKETCNELGA